MDPITITLPGWNQISSYFFPPESTDNVIVFPFKTSSQKFSRTVDSTRITQDKATLGDINNVLTIFELVLSRFDSTRKFLLTLILPIFIPYMMFVNNWWLYASKAAETLRLFAMIFVFLVVTYSIFKRMRQTGRTKADIQRMLEMVRPAYAKRGLTWYFKESFFCSWLELKKEPESFLRVDVHQDGLIHQEGSNDRVLEDFIDAENIVVCVGKNLTGPDFKAPVQIRYVIYIIIFGWISLSLISAQYYRYFGYSSYYYNNYYY